MFEALDFRDGLTLLFQIIFVVAVTVGGFLISAVVGCFTLGGASLLLGLLFGLRPDRKVN